MTGYARLGATLAAWVLLTGCASLDPTSERDQIAAEVAARSGASPAAAGADDLTTAANEEVRRLLASALTAEAAVRIALLHNHRVRAAWARLGIARADLVQAGLLRNPAFDWDVRFLEGGGTDMEFGLSAPLIDLFLRPLRQRLGEHEFAAARLRLTEELVALVFAVRAAFVDALASEQLVAVHRQALQAAAAAHELQAVLHQAGNTTDQALAIERAGETRARLDLAAAEQSAAEAREPLQALLGLWGADTEWTLAGELDPEPLRGVDLSAVESRAIASSLELAAHREGLDALAQQAGLASWRSWFPELITGPNGIRVPGGRFGFGPRLEGELPLFDTGSARRARAGAELEAGMHDHVQLAVEIRALARRLRHRCAQLAAQATFQREVHLPQRAEVVRTTLQVYNAMQIGAFDVLAQQQQQLRDRADAVRTLQEAHRAKLALQQLLAGGMPPIDDEGIAAASRAHPRSRR